MPEWDTLVEWFSIFFLGLGVVFTCGRNKQAREEDRRLIDELRKNVFPDNSEREIIRQSDLDRQYEQIEKLLTAMEKNLIQIIQVELRNNS